MLRRALRCVELATLYAFGALLCQCAFPLNVLAACAVLCVGLSLVIVAEMRWLDGQPQRAS
jgi:hypothetical protein